MMTSCGMNIVFSLQVKQNVFDHQTHNPQSPQPEEDIDTRWLSTGRVFSALHKEPDRECSQTDVIDRNSDAPEDASDDE